MELKFEIGQKEKTELIIKRNSFNGKFTYSENGIQQELRSSLKIGTHINLKLTNNYEFEVGNKEKHKIEIKHKRPLFLAGFRPQYFEIKINNKLEKKYKGY
ncbi:hypothetical protein BTO04_00415 [Polaribacter sp. SA4-10]|uniref:hypothetical protein n=1 Tax=Polaribacter sp. SA4-10 TaxID=754397 RepID=UPI000B3D04CE|nr:hypothetical protein [Polaribacter sp. SA4-10]ARV05246.1 hypothetical protein BTO04_00415 [Polaribacter sp. SA4-10]